jgi:hypothetical protein
MSFLTLHAFLSLSLFLVSGFQFQIPLFPFPFTFFQFASFAPTHVTLRAAFGRLPSQRPLSCVQVSNSTLFLSVSP